MSDSLWTALKRIVFERGDWERFVARAFICGPWYRDLMGIMPEMFDRWYVIGGWQFRRRVAVSPSGAVMTIPNDEHDFSESLRAIDSPSVKWPPKVGDRIHYNSGWHETSWSAEVRGVIDDKAVIVRRPGKYGLRYEVFDRTAFGVWTWSHGPLRMGPLPKALTCEKFWLEAKRARKAK